MTPQRTFYRFLFCLAVCGCATAGLHGTTTRSCAQQVSYPASTHVSPPYPATDGAIHSKAPIHSNAPSSMPNAFDRDSDSDGLADHVELAWHRNSVESPFPRRHTSAAGGGDRLIVPPEPVSPYRVDMIDSARATASELRVMASRSAEVAASLADENAAFVEQWANLATEYMTLSARVDDVQSDLDSTTADFEDVRSKLDRYGLTATIGLILRNKKEQLHQQHANDSVNLFTNEQLRRARERQLELEMVAFDGSQPVEQSADVFAAVGIDVGDASQAAVVNQVQNLLHQRDGWLAALRQGYQDYQQKLGEFDSAVTASAELNRDYRKLIDRHVIWIRDGNPIAVRDLHELQPGLIAAFDGDRGQDFGFWIGQKWKDSPASGIGLAVFVVLAMLIRWRSKVWLVGIGTRNRMRDHSRDLAAAAAAGLTVVVASVIPLVLYAISRWLGSGVVSESTLHASSGFGAAALIAFLIEPARQLLREFGIMHRHVDLELPGRNRAQTYLTVVGTGWALAAYAVTVLALIDHGNWRDSTSRFGFLAALLLVVWTAHLALRPSGGFLEPLIAKLGGKVIHRVRLMIYLVGIGFPIAMFALVCLGYNFTARALLMRACLTLGIAMIAATLWPSVKILSARGWQMLTGAEPPPPQYDEYGEIPAEQSRVGTVTGALGEHFLELKHQLAFLFQCALVLAAVFCLGWLWIDVFPDIKMGNPVLWTVNESTTISTIDEAGQTMTSTLVEPVSVTALHVLVAAGILFVAFQFAKLLPALFDALVLQRVSFDEAMEHFSLVLGRCLLFGVGCFIACRLMGVRWQSIQWLAVGLTIGLGFGLQDMVRNLFGGLIVLFEKPARLGDFISVGRMTGRVAAQRLRTTVLSDDDGREVIIPNKNFVSEEVVNWMGAGRLSVIPIEIAATRDQRPADLCRMLQELVLEQPDVLLTPAPQATLVCVGKNSQRIEIRAWIEDDRSVTMFRDSLHKIVKRFLSDKGWLAKGQPRQPDISLDDGRRKAEKPRRRSA